MTVGGLVLAAGGSTRFGDAPKQLAPLDGRPLLQHAVDAARAAGLHRVAVVLGARADEVRAAVDLRGVEVVVCAGWEEGLAASLRAGVAALAGDCDWVVVTLGDQPRVTAEAIGRVAAACGPDADAARATYDGRPGHPIALGPALLARVASLRGDVGAKNLMTGGARVRAVPVDTLGSPADVDTPTDLETLPA